MINIRRLGVSLLVFAILMVPVYLLLLRPGNKLEEGFSNAVLLDTPPIAGKTKVGLKEGELAPNFEISTVDGTRVRLSELRGRPVLISFFALWCGSCLAEMPDIKSLQEERGLDSFDVIAINTGETRARALDFIDFINAPFTWALDFDLTVSDAYGVWGLPYSVYIDADGVVRAVYSGLAEKARLNAYIDAAIAAGTPPDFPDRLRTISNIPRDRILTVETPTSDRVLLASRSLRCDPSYCASAAETNVEALVGVFSVKKGQTSEGIPSLEVLFNPEVTQPNFIADAVVRALSALSDPVYQTPLEVRFTAN